VSRTEGIIFGFRPFGEPGEPAALAQRPDPVATTGQNFVRITLVAHIPDQAVFRCVEHVMNGGGQFDDAKPGTEMSAGFRNRIDQFRAQFVRNFGQA